MDQHQTPATHGEASASLDFGPFHATDATYRPNVHVPRHDHLRSGFTLTVTGSYVERFLRSEKVAPTGAVLIKPAHAVHSNRFGSAGCRCFLVGIDQEYLASHRQLAGATKQIALHTRGPIPDIMRRMYREFRSAQIACGLVLEGLALELAAMVLRSTDRAPRPPRPPCPPRVPPRWLARVREQLDAAIRGPNPVFSDLAGAAGVHPVYLSRAFRAAYGCTPGDYLRRLRIERAQRLLAESDVPLSQVAVAVGYYDQSHFTGAFRRATGTTPAQYRKIQTFPAEV